MSGANSPVVTTSRAKSRNVLKGIVPTYEAFGVTAPTNLKNATDGDETNPCGTGVGTASSNTIGFFKFDRGAGNTYPILVDMNAGVWSNSGGIWAVCAGSPDGNNYFPGGFRMMANVVATSEIKGDISPVIIHTRYFRILFGTSDSSVTGNITLYEVAGYQFTP